MAQNRHIYALFGLSTATPKPRAEGSSHAVTHYDYFIILMGADDFSHP